MIRRADLLAYEPERSAFGAAQALPQYLRDKYPAQAVESNDI
jgi:hypothetical protein